jgi:hypothetical protein
VEAVCASFDLAPQRVAVVVMGLKQQRAKDWAPGQWCERQGTIKTEERDETEQPHLTGSWWKRDPF